MTLETIIDRLVSVIDDCEKVQTMISDNDNELFIQTPETPYIEFMLKHPAKRNGIALDYMTGIINDLNALMKSIEAVTDQDSETDK